MVIANTLMARDTKREPMKIGKLVPIEVPKRNSESLASIERTENLGRRTPRHFRVRTNSPKRRKRSTLRAQGRSMLTEEAVVQGEEVAMKAREDPTRAIERLETAETVAIMVKDGPI